MHLTNPEVFNDGDERGAKPPPSLPNVTTQLIGGIFDDLLFQFNIL
jgi:hypothetical protein